MAIKPQALSSVLKLNLCSFSSRFVLFVFKLAVSFELYTLQEHAPESVLCVRAGMVASETSNGYSEFYFKKATICHLILSDSFPHFPAVLALWDLPQSISFRSSLLVNKISCQAEEEKGIMGAWAPQTENIAPDTYF